MENFLQTTSWKNGNPSGEMPKDLVKFAETIGYSLEKVNGQRILRHPKAGNLADKPEIFVGHLPANSREDEIFTAFSYAGPIAAIRLMVNFRNESRRFCYISYFRLEHCRKAVALFNNCAVDGKHIKVAISINLRRLHVSGIPDHLRVEEVRTEMEKLVGGITNVVMLPKKNNPNLNRGYAFLIFESHGMAYKAHTILASGMVEIWGVKIVVNWARPVPELDEATVKSVSA